MEYLIWSIEHDAWWRPGWLGYTKELAEAGRYDEDAARKVLQRANLVKVNECLVPVECAGIREPTAEDRALSLALAAVDDPMEFANRLFAYYHDNDRARRTPRELMYLHLGQATGMLARLDEQMKRGAN